MVPWTLLDHSYGPHPVILRVGGLWQVKTLSTLPTLTTFNRLVTWTLLDQVYHTFHVDQTDLLDLVGLG